MNKIEPNSTINLTKSKTFGMKWQYYLQINQSMEANTNPTFERITRKQLHDIRSKKNSQTVLNQFYFFYSFPQIELTIRVSLVPRSNSVRVYRQVQGYFRNFTSNPHHFIFYLKTLTIYTHLQAPKFQTELKSILDKKKINK